MEILITPNDSGRDRLSAVYAQAFREAHELYVATAYLTNWEFRQRLSSSCNRIVFVAGTDFGLTRKSALRAVLRWMPKRGSVLFGAVTGVGLGGFHPKVLLWRTRSGNCYALVGSSNLSRAAFESNYEANVFTRITPAEYRRIGRWLDSIAAKSAPVNEDWIAKHYREAKRVPQGGVSRHSLTPSMNLRLPRGARYAAVVRRRRRSQSRWREIAGPIESAAKRCVEGRITNAAFWREFWHLWSTHAARFQGRGLEISGKRANWRQACRGLLRILGAARRGVGPELDHLVSVEIDALESAGNAARGAWLSEMLCHFLPRQYPLLNGPIEEWLKANHWRSRRGATEGQRYTELAQQLRLALAEGPAGARNLAELDAAIWQWVADNL